MQHKILEQKHIHKEHLTLLVGSLEPTTNHCSVDCVMPPTEESIETFECHLCGEVHHNDAQMLFAKIMFAYQARYFADNDVISLQICEGCLYNFIIENNLLNKCVQTYNKEIHRRYNL